MKFTDISRNVPIAKDPAVIYFNEKYFMYYSISPGKESWIGWDIGIAVSEDLEIWENIGTISRTGEVEKNGICSPGAVVKDGKIHLFYQSYGNGAKDAICHAVSTDGINFHHDKTNPVFRAFGDWNNGRAIDAEAVFWNGYLYLYFATRDPSGEVQFIGVARAPENSDFDRKSFKQCCSAPVIKPEFDWEKSCTEAPAALIIDDRMYLLYAGAFNNSPQQIGLAVSDDGINFSKLSDKPFIPAGKPLSWNHSESGHPFCFKDRDGRIYVFFQGNNDNGKSWYISKAELIFEDGDFLIKYDI